MPNLRTWRKRLSMIFSYEEKVLEEMPARSRTSFRWRG